MSEKEKVQSEILAHQEEQGLPKELHEGGGQEVATCGYDASKDLGVHAVEMAPTERLKLRRQMAEAAGKKSATSLSLFMEAYGLEVRRGTFYFDHPVLGRRSLDGEMVPRKKRSVDEANSRGSIVEAGKSSCRSSDVRDP